ncbi:rubrerythrin family protein [Herbivorax sp. ANBcel31]|uniref:rubrerythrin n=1 Tax=Herbivorax sp. ANBcel31 TaxID=3069754 RepID=UPI0027B2F82A|nr:rubrerythrin family protein [Herbivorax sp. ANBcel31]MDQ2086809.1 rubrerythrin family protein [Herbivorax sp. ANBcel31]
MKSLKGTKTMENLMKAFAGESQARNRYTYYASVAKKEGYKQIEGIFIETADNEKEHAKRFYKFLLAGLDGELPATVEINADFPVAQGTTLDNLKAAADGENEEWSDLYPEFAKVAEQEGFSDVATAFKMISKAEERHEIRYRKLAKNIAENTVFKKDNKISWKCRNCGYVHEGDSAPEQCPACVHPKAHFEVLAENY